MKNPRLKVKFHLKQMMVWVVILFLFIISSIPVQAPDTDKDGLSDNDELLWSCDPNDWDTDDDGMPDGWEVKFGLNPWNPNGDDDHELDGLTNLEEYSYNIPPTWNVSIDSVWWNGTDPTNLDTDNDSMIDGWEVTNGLNPLDNGTIDPNNGPDGDPDNDEATNYQEYIWKTNPHDWDTDSDKLPDTWELIFGLNPYRSNGDEDQDLDGLTNLEEYSYNIPPTWNVTINGVWWGGTDPASIDTDNDSLSDGWETLYNLDPTDDGTLNPKNGAEGDPDNDGATNFQEYNLLLDPTNWDTDDDQMPDGWEIYYKLLPYIADGNEDKDSDTLTNIVEYRYKRPASWAEELDGVWWGGTNPNNRDSDGDTLPDDWEIKYNLNPNDNGTIKTNHGEEGDPDSDNLLNKDEYKYGTSPIESDSDGDGMPDGWEVENGLEPMLPSDGDYDDDGDGLTNFQEFLNGTDPNNNDTDSDNIPDGWEVKYGLNPLDSDDSNEDPDGDGISNFQEYLKGTNPKDSDTDDDGDNDGYNDTIELKYNTDPYDSNSYPLPLYWLYIPRIEFGGCTKEGQFDLSEYIIDNDTEIANISFMIMNYNKSSISVEIEAYHLNIQQINYSESTIWLRATDGVHFADTNISVLAHGTGIFQDDLDNDGIPDDEDDDIDGDGILNDQDDFPRDPDKSKKQDDDQSDFFIYVGILIAIIILIILTLFILIRKKRLDE
ncbi:MAG: hypothetical protein KAJ51_15675 [Thermoplasmata archaeon]|nr:hypothetical protein [Thermoplasmata archaeon]